MTELNISESLPMLPAPTRCVSPSLPSPNFQAFFVWAEKLFESHRIEEAQGAYSECLRLDPSEEKALYKRGLANGLLKNPEECLNDFRAIFLQHFLKQANLPDLSIYGTRGGIIPDMFVEDTIEFQDLKKALDEDLVALFAEEERKQKTKKPVKQLSEPISLVSSQVQENGKNKSQPTSEAESILKETEELIQVKVEKYHGTPETEEKSETIRLSDVQGLEDVKANLWNKVVLPMKRPELFAKYRKKRSSAVLLYGPPGCGKTLLARALAGETGSELVIGELHVLFSVWFGDSQKSIHALFEDARKKADKGKKSCIIFLDELDALGVDRGQTRVSDTCHRDAIDQLLMELDGIVKNPEGLFIVAASNRPWDIDPALKRSGRIGECIYIPAPTCRGREDLFRYYVGGCAADNLDFARLAGDTEGFSCADVEAVVEEAKMKPLLREQQTGVESPLRMADFDAVLADPVFGKGTLKDWCISAARNLSEETIDSQRYKPMFDDIKNVLQQSSPPTPRMAAIV